MFIRNGLRFNVHSPIIWNDVLYPNALDPVLQAALGVTEIPDPEPPEGFDLDNYVVTEIDASPYVVYTLKPPEYLAAVRGEKIKAYRDHLTDTGGCLVEGKWFHTDPKSKIQFLGLMLAGANFPPNLMWKTMDGSFVLMTHTLVLQIFAAQTAREHAIFSLAEQKRLDDSPIYEGWPERYISPEELAGHQELHPITTEGSSVPSSEP